MREPDGETLLEGVTPASEGKGPLLQRDYWAVIRSCRTSPSGLLQILQAKFWELAPPQLARFRYVRGENQPLRLGDGLEVTIRGTGTFGVRVVHIDRQSFTVATMKGHPEAGRITFGAYRNPRRDVVFHIRSRARSRSNLRYLGFLTGGEPMQTSTWCELINRTAASVGEGAIGFIRAETRVVDEDDGDRLVTSPTFRATGD